MHGTYAEWCRSCKWRSVSASDGSRQRPTTEPRLSLWRVKRIDWRSRAHLGCLRQRLGRSLRWKAYWLRGMCKKWAWATVSGSRWKVMTVCPLRNPAPRTARPSHQVRSQVSCPIRRQRWRELGPWIVERASGYRLGVICWELSRIWHQLRLLWQKRC